MQTAAREDSLAPRINHETHVPTLQSQARTYARLSHPHENARRPSCDFRTPRQRPQAPGRLRRRFIASQALELQRLQTRAQFQAVLAGTTVARSEHFALHRRTLVIQAPTSQPCVDGNEVRQRPLFPVADLWLGAMVPKRWAKRATTRNAIKRQIYNVSADFSPQQSAAAFVVRLRRDFSRKVYLSASSDQLKQAVRSELQQLMQDGESQP